MEIVINECYGGFCVSRDVYKELDIKDYSYEGGWIDNKTLGIKSSDALAYRADKRLLAAIKKVGIEKASGKWAKLSIIEIDPPRLEDMIESFDGYESVKSY